MDDKAILLGQDLLGAPAYQERRPLAIHDNDAEGKAIQHGERGVTAGEDRGDALLELFGLMSC